MLGKTLLAAVSEYTEKQPIELNLSRRTTEARKGYITKLLAYLGDKPFTLETAREYILCEAKRNLQSSSLRCIAKTIKAFAHFLYKRKYISENWGNDIDLPKLHKKPITCLPAEVCEKMIIAGTEEGPGDRARSKRIKREVRCALRFILRTGLRISELIKLKYPDLRFDDNPPSFLVHSKGGSQDILPLPRDMIEELKQRKERSLFLIFPANVVMIL